MAFRRRLAKLFLIACVGLSLVWLRMMQLQVLQGEAWVAEAQKKRQRRLEIPAPRGRILDANGRVLAVDQPVYQLALVGWDWKHRARVRCTACGAVHFHAPDRSPPKRCACRGEDSTLEPMAAADVSPLEDLLELETGEIERRARKRLDDIEKLVAGLKERLERESRAEFLIHDRVRQYERDLLHRPYAIVRRLPREAVGLVELDEDGEYRGLLIRTDLRRHYPEGGPSSQMLGYVSVIQDEAELEHYRKLYGDHVTLDTRVGREGAEYALERLLLGRKGWERQARDSDGRFTQTVAADPPRRGSEVRLAVTARACLQAEAAMKRYDDPREYYPGTRASGGFVALDAETGAILAWGEMPRLEIEKDLDTLFEDADRFAQYDPLLGQWCLPDDVDPPRGESLEQWRARLCKPAPRHFSRVSQIAVEPGSTFKVFIGLGMLDGLAQIGPGVLLPKTYYECHGQHGHPRCHVHRAVGLESAIEVSCNPFFSYSVRDHPRYWKVWRRTLPMFLDSLGFGRPTGVDVRAESAGILLKDWVDFNLVEVAQQTLNRVRMQHGVPAGQLTFRVHGRVPPLVAGRGPDRLQRVLERTLLTALSVAGPQGRVVLNVTPGERRERYRDFTFEAYAQPHPDGPAPRAPDLAGVRQAVAGLGGRLEAARTAPGIYTFGFTLRYHEAIGRKAGDPPVILEDDGRNVAIGQGPITATPLQMARAVAAVANGGRLVTPHLVDTADGVEQGAEPVDLHLDPRHLGRIRAGMRAVVEGYQGTARRAAWHGVPATVYGKTGTAQVGSWWTLGQRPDDGPWHHWFVGFAEHPRQRTIAFAMVLHSRMERAASYTSVNAVCDFLSWWFTQGPDVGER